MDVNQAGAGRQRLLPVVLIFLTAVAVGLPTLRGGFVGGDDRRLVLNHVLVNHPSLAHAAELFTIIHRDLYQPLPLLSFSAEFAVAGGLGLLDEGIAGGAWLFHLTNVLLHAVNAVLVWALITAWSARPDDQAITPAWVRETCESSSAVATMAAMLFAVHPLQVEVIAWLNGRMMLMSTLFALTAVVSLGIWMRDGGLRWAIAVVACVALCGLSKVRIGLPFLLVLIPLVRGVKPNRRLILIWSSAVVVMGALVVVNVVATAKAGMFEGAAGVLHGSGTARSVMALAWYFQHYLWPTDLAAWYPTPRTVLWSDSAALRASLIVLPVAMAIAWAAQRRRIAIVGFGWFFLTIAATLPLIPSRNTLAADRYMYLPIVGLVWVTATALWAAYRYARTKWQGAWFTATVSTTAMLAIVAMVAMSWHVASFYDTYLSKAMRLATLFPDTPHVWERVGWSYYSRERYEEAIAAARREFAHDDNELRSTAHIVIGVSQLRLGKREVAIDSLRQAVAYAPQSASAKFRLASALEEVGQLTEALSLYEAMRTIAPLYNPGLNKLAELYRRFDRSEDARQVYEQALANNPYEVPAALGLAELDIELGTNAALAAAEKRLTGLLAWMPENTTARTNLGVVHAARGRLAEAMAVYESVLERDPNNATAAVNLAQIYQDKGRSDRAGPLFERAVARVEAVDQAVSIHDFYIAQRQPDRAVALWLTFLGHSPDSDTARGFLVWSYALAGDMEDARAMVRARSLPADVLALGAATRTYVALVEERYADATNLADRLGAFGVLGSNARQRLLGALQRLDEQRPNVPWTFCIAAQLLLADERTEAAKVSVDLCDQHCADTDCRERIRILRDDLRSGP